MKTLSDEDMATIKRIKNNMEGQRESAEAIMDGGENYDGADGARYVLDLCDDMDTLLSYLGA